MNLREKLYQLFVLGTDGDGLQTALKQGLGGVIFFSHDIESKKQFTNLIIDLKKISKTPPFLSIDQEGGRVERTENIHSGKKYLSAKFAFEKGVLHEQTQKIAEELHEYGINLNFAPCIDVNTNPNNPIIGERAFSSNPDDVIEASKIVTETYIENGIIPCVKHFPGHGDANADSHLSLPQIDLPLEIMEKTHIKPFRAAVLDGISMVMVAHLHCTCFDENKIPTSMSKNAISYLREKLNYKGIIITDDMIMHGVQGFSPDIAIKAGVDMFIYRDSKPETIDIIEKIFEKAQNDSVLKENIEKSFERVQALKRTF